MEKLQKKKLNLKIVLLDEEKARAEKELQLVNHVIEYHELKVDDRCVVSDKRVGELIHFMSFVYDQLQGKFQSLNYPDFCNYFFHRFRFTKHNKEEEYLSFNALLAYFKKERAGEYYRK